MIVRALALAALLAAGQAAPDPHRPKPTLDHVAPALLEGIEDGVLIVSKTNGWRHIEHIPHSNAVLADIAEGLGHPAFVTENGAVFNDAQLARFSVVVLNSATGTFLTPDQRAAFARYVAGGGGVVALHAAGDSSHEAPWYVDTVIGTRFIGHPGGGDHLQHARITIARPDHPVMKGVVLPWAPRDEWYSFAGNPTESGMTVLARIDEDSYRVPPELAMGDDHPVIWTNPQTTGHVVYSALGHMPGSYDDPNYRRLLTNAIRWAAE
ncbi:ThuA domain-containing protein [Stakelama saccharophila]|uniref:ThuA domain-containing protein n=1 Tax=Stakelama saccharophila TaxID=3075605 RepID=A0ABZ0BCK1_9SPHN|nr:ThuA domain-containing protein [Stakelama sp. W311]WNO54401.1 ThuA domain-containing protein [Stakelama sp. W311]